MLTQTGPMSLRSCLLTPDLSSASDKKTRWSVGRSEPRASGLLLDSGALQASGRELETEPKPETFASSVSVLG